MNGGAGSLVVVAFVGGLPLCCAPPPQRCMGAALASGQSPSSFGLPRRRPCPPCLSGGILQKGGFTMISANLTNALRQSIYRRDGYRCAICDSPRGLQIHHVVHRSQGGADTAHNLITLCWRCHAVAHGTRMPECPAYMDAVEMGQACVEYLADMYLADWWPYEEGF